MNNRPKRYFTLLLLIVTVACSDDDVNCDEVQPEPFRFRLVDQAGNNQLTPGERPNDIKILFFRNNGVEVTTGVEYEGSAQETYGSSPVVSYSSVFENVEIYYLERDSNVDTLLVRASQRDPGNRCAGFSFDEVVFNGVTATLDNTVEPPVYVLVE